MTPSYSQLLSDFESYLLSHKPRGHPASLYEPISYINEIGGKRVRPLLVLLTYHCWNKDVQQAMPVALAIEYFHNFSLMHDDIMDEAPLRRGRPSVHEKFGKNAAILSGDALLIKCFQLLAETEVQLHSPGLVSMMAKATLDICEGQQMDLDFERSDLPTEEEYLEMIRKKTACLIGASMMAGAMITHTSSEVQKALYSCGENFGMAFQIEDDLLDIFGDPVKTGKQAGGDILQGKRNYLFVSFLSMLNEKQKTEFRNNYHAANTQEKVAEIKNIYQQAGIEDQVTRKIKAYQMAGMKDLQSIPFPGKEELSLFFQSLTGRDH